MVNEKRKMNFIQTFTEGSAIHNLNDETLRESIGILSEEGEKEVKSKMNQQKNKPFHILRKSFV